MHQIVSHKERLKNVDELLEEFCDRARALGPQLGPILIQLPPTFHRDEERLAAFLPKLPSDLRFAFEFRSKTWLDDRVFALLKQHNVAIVENISPDNSCVYTAKQTADFAYVRFHKKLGSGETDYPLDVLKKHAARFAARRRAGTTQYIYFMNDIAAHGPRNAEKLVELVEKISGAKCVKGWKRKGVVQKGGKGSLQSFFGKAASSKAQANKAPSSQDDNGDASSPSPTAIEKGAVMTVAASAEGNQNEGKEEKEEEEKEEKKGVGEGKGEQDEVVIISDDKKEGSGPSSGSPATKRAKQQPAAVVVSTSPKKRGPQKTLDSFFK